LELTLDWIGNMPRLLVSQWKWKVLSLPQEEIQPGDLLFLGNQVKGMISHVALALSPKEAFHCSWETGGGSIEPIETLCKRYQQPASPAALLDYVDPRTTY
jgi:cell wall-associated NlpC family hydrolase